jgi:hypothetical protein
MFGGHQTKNKAGWWPAAGSSRGGPTFPLWFAKTLAAMPRALKMEANTIHHITL